MPDLVGHDKQPSAFIVYLYLVGSPRNQARADDSCEPSDDGG